MSEQSLQTYVSPDLSDHFQKLGMYLSRPRENYTILWRTIQHTIQKTAKRRHAEELPNRLPLEEYRDYVTFAQLEEFLDNYRQRLSKPVKREAKELRDFREKLLHCCYLPGNEGNDPCHQKHLCPFCQCEDSAMPLYGLFGEELDRLEQLTRSDPANQKLASLITCVIFCKGKVKYLDEINEAVDKMLYLSEKIQDDEKIDDEYAHCLRICFQGTDIKDTTVALRGLFLVRRHKVQSITTRLEGIISPVGEWSYTPFQKSRINNYIATRYDLKNQVGAVYHYPIWKLTSPVADIYKILRSVPVFNETAP